MKVSQHIRDLASGGTFRRIRPNFRAALSIIASEFERREKHHGHGRERLDVHFGLSRASFSVLPRVMMNAMSDDWQNRMADLLDEMEQEFPNAPDMDFKVRGAGPSGRLAKLDPALCDYRRPDHRAIARWRRQPITSADEFIDAVRECLGDKWAAGDVEGYLADLDGQFGAPGFSWDWDAAETIAQEIIEAGE